MLTEENIDKWLEMLIKAGFIAAAAAVVFLIALLVRKVYGYFWLFRRKTVFLELTPPASNDKVPEATQRLFAVLHGLGSRPFIDYLLRHREAFSLETVSTLEGGIRYLMRVPADEVPVFEQHIVSYLPDVKVRRIEDYLPDGLDYLDTRVLDFKQTGYFAYPLQLQGSIKTHDPGAYITGAMTKLEKHELVSLQVVVSPVQPREAKSVSLRLMQNEEYLYNLRRQPRSIPGTLVNGINTLLMGLLDLIGDVVSGTSSTPASYSYDTRRKHDAALKRQPARLLSPTEQEMAYSVQAKLAQPLFQVSIRVLVKASSKQRRKQRQSGIKAALDSFKTGYQALKARPLLVGRLQGRYRLWAFRYRLPAFLERKGALLAASELADLYHFPHVPRTEGLVKSRSRPLPAVLSQRASGGFDVVVGSNDYGGETLPVGLTLKQRRKHAYIIGQTGTGKTTLLTGSIYQDILSGKGLAVLDAHGDMFRELLGLIPEHRRQDVVVFDPSDRDYPVGLNILDPGIPFASEDDRHEWITSTVLSVFAKLADEKQWGSRMEHILRSATMTALQLPDPSLYTLQRLLTDKKFQREAAKTIEDPVLKQFWQKEFRLMGRMQMSSATAPLTHRLGHFITTRMSRHILLQQKSTLRMADVMNEGKILLVNLSKGDIGEDQSAFFGTILTSFIWMAAYQRTRIPEKQRRDFFVYVDEFQNFATPRFAEITSEGRKFHVSLTVSHQNIAQIEDKSVLKTVAANSGTMICLKASPEDENFILPFMKPEVEKGDIVNLEPYSFYMRVTGDRSEDAFSGRTAPLATVGSDEIRQKVIDNSRAQYGTPKKTVEDYLAKLMAPEPEKKKRRGKVSKDTGNKGSKKLNSM